MQYIIQQEQNMRKLVQLKLAIFCFIALFVTLIGLGQMFSNSVLTIGGLLFFTAAAAAITYYLVLTEA
ncbi:MAG: hypothetical protein NWE93_08295 [Candidatus Bathyarchaeota archaeon]|nr:hypothetical protein [Candidatus Bathyarchaeota archaeon]